MKSGNSGVPAPSHHRSCTWAEITKSLRPQRNHQIIMNQGPLNDVQKILLIIMACVLPPLAVGLLNSRCDMRRELVVSIILMFFGFFPSTVFTIYCIFVQYPRNLADHNGYRRLDEEAAESGTGGTGETNQNGQNSQHHQHHQTTPNHQNLQTNETDPLDSPVPSSLEAPPHYDDVVQPRDDKSTGDHKVQQ